MRVCFIEDTDLLAARQSLVRAFEYPPHSVLEREVRVVHVFHEHDRSVLARLLRYRTIRRAAASGQRGECSPCTSSNGGIRGSRRIDCADVPEAFLWF